jgi:hypothetical protein
MSRSTLARTIALAAVALALTTSSAAAAAQPIGSNQHFSGQVNGSAQPGTSLFVVCLTKHPRAGQTISVVLDGPGFTGAASSVQVTMLAPTTAILGNLTQYGQRAPIPTNLVMPCAGTGLVVFTPQPGVGGRPESLQVGIVPT